MSWVKETLTSEHTKHYHIYPDSPNVSGSPSLVPLPQDIIYPSSPNFLHATHLCSHHSSCTLTPRYIKFPVYLIFLVCPPACCCQVASVVSDSVWPHRRQPTRLPRPWDSPGKNTGVGCHFLLQCMKMESESEVTQSCLTLSYPMDCSLPGSSIHGIFRATVLEWGAIAFSEEKSK